VEEPDSGGGAHLTEMCGVKQRGESGPAGCGSRKKFYFWRPTYVRWSDREKPLKVEQLSVARYFWRLLGPTVDSLKWVGKNRVLFSVAHHNRNPQHFRGGI
jgi:hypothetical protein